MNLNLFAIRDLTTGRIIPNLFFTDKQKAKTKRDELGAKRDELGAKRHCVTFGPDHRHYKG